MNTNKLLAAAVLAAAIGAPIAGFISDMKGQPMTSTGVRVPFLHGFPIGPICRSKRAGIARARERMAEFAAADAGGPARQGRPGQFLDLHLHQLAAPASICPRLGREIQGPGTGGDRRPCAGVRIRKEHRQRSLGCEGHGASTTRSRSTTTMAFGAHSGTRPGRRCISSMRKDASAITSLARVLTNSRKWSSRRCCGRPAPPTSVASRLRWMPAVTTPLPIGATSDLRKTMSGLSAPKTSHLRAEHCGTSLACIKGPRG